MIKAATLCADLRGAWDTWSGWPLNDKHALLPDQARCKEPHHTPENEHCLNAKDIDERRRDEWARKGCNARERVVGRDS